MIRRQGPGVRAQGPAAGRSVAAIIFVAALISAEPRGAQSPVRGLTATPALARAYDAILNADFDRVATELSPACQPVPVWCDVMTAVSVWWEIALEPDDRSLDPRLQRVVDTAIATSEAWTRREPARAEAWFAHGAVYATRAQWRVLRTQRLSAARDGKRIKEALERALTIDPQLHDAKFGLGMYRYYADVAPAALRWLRWLLLLPGGDRNAGLQDMLDARDRGLVVSGEAAYQIHLVYLWYEQRSPEALLLIHDLQRRYPRNPLFHLAAAEIHDVYFHDVTASERSLEHVIALANTRRINSPSLAIRRATASLTALRARKQR